jgi:hypothetical protein
LSAERGDRVDKNVEREILNHRMLQNPNVVGFKEVQGCWAATTSIALGATAAHAELQRA